MDIKTTLWTSHRTAEAVGRVVTGLDALRKAVYEVFLIIEGSPAEKVATDRLGVNFEGVTAFGHIVIPFAGLETWDNDSGEPCVAFVTAGLAGLFAPARAINAPDIAETVARFEARWRKDVDHVYVSDLNGAIHAGAAPRIEIVDGELRAGNETLLVADLTWAETKEDGDGNSHCHLVTKDGLYRLISYGDLGR